MLVSHSKPNRRNQISATILTAIFLSLFSHHSFGTPNPDPQPAPSLLDQLEFSNQFSLQYLDLRVHGVREETENTSISHGAGTGSIDLDATHSPTKIVFGLGVFVNKFFLKGTLTGGWLGHIGWTHAFDAQQDLSCFIEYRYDEELRHGLGLRLRYEYKLSDRWSLGLDGGYFRYHTPDVTGITVSAYYIGFTLRREWH